MSILATSFLGLTALAFFVLPENIDAVKHFLIVRYTSRTTLRLIRVVHGLGAALELARRTVRGKIATLLVATIFIWTLEAGALWAMTRAIVGTGASPGLLAVLSDAFRPLASVAMAEQLATHRAMVLTVLLALSALAATALSLPMAHRAPARA